MTTQVNCPGAGTLTGTLTALGKTRATKKPVLGTSSMSVSKAGKVTLKVKLNAAGRKALKKKGKIKAKLTIRFKPTGAGKASSKSKTVTLRAPKKKP